MLISFFSGSIPLRIQILSIISSLLLLGFVINLIKREKLKEGYSIIWFFICSSLVIFSLFAGLLDSFASLVGISYAPAALFIILAGGLLLLGLHFSVLISNQDRRLRELTQEHALLKQTVDQKESIQITPEVTVGISKTISTPQSHQSKVKEKAHV